MLKLGPGPLAIVAEAPFRGWKVSAIGPPEHGRWDPGRGGGLPVQSCHNAPIRLVAH
jgi:hypothetical protein